MKIVVSILIALIFTLFGLLKFEGYFELGTVNLIGYDDTFDANLSFLKTIGDYTFYIPELIFNSKKELFENLLKIDEKSAYLLIIFLFFGIITGLLVYVLKYFPKREERVYLVLGVIASYYLIVEFMI